MSDHEADFSANGHEAGSHAVGTETQMGGSSPDENTFLAELARAMQATAAAEQARNAEGTEQRRQTHIDAIRAREALEAEELREFAKDDVKGIDAWSDGEIKRIKLERERRIAARREQLQIRLEEHRNVVSREVEAVEAAIAAYKAEIEHYFRRLEAETDPVAIARYAGTRPPFPVLELIGAGDAPAIYAYPPISRPAVSAVASPIEEPASTDDDTPSGYGEAAAGDAGTSVASADVVEAEAEPADAALAEAEPAAAAEAEPAMAGAVVADPAATDTTTLIGVMDPATETPETASPWQGSAVSDADHASDATQLIGSAEPAATDDASAEPVAAVAEARVVMPRPAGAGSWLRWPNSSGDRSDPSH